MKVFIFIALCLVVSVSANLYQTCGTCNVEETQTHYWWWWWSPSYCVDAGGLALPMSQHYTLNLNSTANLYFNLCGPSDICNGALACIINTQYGNDPHVLAYPNSDPYYYNPSSNSIQMNFDYHGPFDDYRYFSAQISCDSSTSFEITNYYLYDDDEVNVYIDSSVICDSVLPESYVAPTQHSDLSGNIFMAGSISMFAMDSVAAATDESTFAGQFYFSTTYNSVKINGTITNQNSQTSEVQYLLKGNMGNDNPPLMVSYVTLPNQQSPQCILLPNSFDDDDEDPNWFSQNNNPYYSVNRTYESVYYSKGTSMQVQTWATYEPYVTLMERISDGMPVSLGGPVIATSASKYESTFISELDWTTLSTSTLDESTFDLPSDWGCQQ